MKKRIIVSCLSLFFLGSCGSGPVSQASGGVSSLPNFPTFTVDFFNQENLLYSSNVIQGGTAVYKGVAPTKESTDPAYRFLFKGWDKSLENIQSNFATHAVFDQQEVYYTVTFRNFDGSSLEVDNVRGGSGVAYHSATPQRPSDNRVSQYVFKGWDKETQDVRSDLFVDALYEENAAMHEVSFLNDDGTLIAKRSCYYGEKVLPPSCYKKAISSDKAYQFSGWDGSFENVTEDRVLKAQYQEVPVTDYLEFTLSGENYLVSQKTPYPAVGSIILPDTYEGKKVVGVADKGFFLNSTLMDLTLGKNILSLGIQSFSSTGLVGLSLDESLQKIDKKAFSSTPLTSLFLPSSLLSLAEDAFLGCDQLAQFTLGDKNTAFVIENDLLMDKAKTMAYLFPHDIEKEQGLIPEGVVSIAPGAFAASKIKNPLQIPSTIATIGAAAFFLFKGSLNFAKDLALKKIDDGAFSYCDVSTLTLPEGLASLGGHAFLNSNLKEISLPSTLITMQGKFFEPFVGCQELEKIEVSSGNPVFFSLDGVLFEKEAQRLLCYPANKKETAYTLPEGTKAIGERSCNGLRNLTSFTMAKSVQEIQSFAFFDSQVLGYNVYKGARYLGTGDNPTFALMAPETMHLAFLDMAPSCVLIAASAFHDVDFPEYTDSLSGISFSSSLRYINSMAFSSSPLLSSLNLPEGLKVIGDAAFSNCGLLKEVYLPDSLEKLAGAVFAIDPLLDASLVEGGYSYLGNPYNPRVYLWKATSEKAAEAVASIPEGVRTIDPNIYGLSETLESISFPSTLRSLSFGSFYFAMMLTSVSFQEGLLSLEESCFDSTGLTSITLPSTLEEVGDNCFNDCLDLSGIHVKSTTLPQGFSKRWLGSMEGLVDVKFGA